MLWLFTQMFVLCAGAFLAGSLLTWLPMRAVTRKLRADLAASPRPLAALPPSGVVVLPEQRTEVAESEQRTDVVESEQCTEVVEPERRTEVVEPEQCTEVVEPEQRTEVVEPEQRADVVESEVDEPGVGEPEADLPVKGNSKSRIFHTEVSPYYRRMKGDVRFRSTEEAERAGYTAWSRRSRSQLAGSAQ